jgi:MYXO-CTERM domain-containing protein
MIGWGVRLLLCATMAVAVVIGAPTPAEAQTICANFWAKQTGTYGDHCSVTVTGATTLQTVHGVEGIVQATSAGTECTYWTTNQVLARIDWWVVGVDPGEEVSFVFNGGAYTLEDGHIHVNPYIAGTPTLAISNGHLVSTGVDGSAYLEVASGMIMTSYGICTTSNGSHGGVVVRTSTNSFCQCGNTHKHYNEGCDDGDTDDGDGCNHECSVEPGWSCTLEYDQQSVCTMGEPDAGVPDASVPDASVPPDAEVPPDALIPDANVPPDALIPDATVPPDAEEPYNDDAGNALPDADVTAPDADPASPDAADDDLPPLDAPGSCSCRGGGDDPTLLIGVLAFAVLVRRRRATLRA